MEIPIKLDDLGVPLFSEIPICFIKKRIQAIQPLNLPLPHWKSGSSPPSSSVSFWDISWTGHFGVGETGDGFEILGANCL